jgi:hypothetical protein
MQPESPTTPPPNNPASDAQALSDLLCKLAVVPQPRPVLTPHSEPVEPLVREFLLGSEGVALLGEKRAREAALMYGARIQMGREKYGQELRTLDGRDTSCDTLQEVLDGLGYAIKDLAECESDTSDLERALHAYDCQRTLCEAAGMEVVSRAGDRLWLRASGLRSAYLQRAAYLRAQVTYFGSLLRSWFDAKDVLGLGWSRADLGEVIDALRRASPGVGEDVTEKVAEKLAEKLAAALPVGGGWESLETLARRCDLSIKSALAGALWLVGPWGDEGVRVHRASGEIWTVRRVKR